MKKLTFINEAMVLTLFSACILIFASCGFDQNSEDTKDIAEEQNEENFESDRQKDDAQFLVNASENNLKQIQLGQLAQQKGQATHVVELGKRMEDSHTKSQRNLTVLAKSKMITIPTQQTDHTQDAYEDLNEKSGEDFDEAYADMMVKSHKDAISTFEKASENSYDRDIKNWASSKLHDLRAHLDQSQECQKKFADMYFEKKQ